jgi:hypothetical protein
MHNAKAGVHLLMKFFMNDKYIQVNIFEVTLKKEEKINLKERLINK